jgi:DNA repair protein RecO (recombination protein O)
MDERSTGIILRTRPLTETSVVVHWLTPELGRLATVAKGARRPKSPFRGKLDLFYEADFSFGRSRKSELHNLREIVLCNTHPRLRQNLGWVQQASYFVALVEQTTETETPLPKVFALVRDCFEMLTLATPSPRTVFAFELKLLEELGLMPDLNAAGIGPGARKVAEVLIQAEWKILPRVKLSEVQTRELRQFLHGFLIYHLERIPHSRASALNAA